MIRSLPAQVSFVYRNKLCHMDHEDGFSSSSSSPSSSSSSSSFDFEKTSLSNSFDASEETVRASLFLRGWWVFLMVNLSSKANRTTQIRIHQNPELAMLQSNTNKNKDQNMWTILMRVGGFRNKRKASEFYEYWNKKSRGLCSRIAKGISLVKKYHRTENIKMWATSRSRDEMISFFNEKRLWLETSTSSTMVSKSMSRSSLQPENRIPHGRNDFLADRRKRRIDQRNRRKDNNRVGISCYCNRISK